MNQANSFSFLFFSSCRQFSNETKSKNVDIKDVENLNSQASDWWNPTGTMKALHSMNKLRVPFIRDGIIGTGLVKKENIGTSKVLSGVEILEVGCGGGILTEPLARLHAKVVGLDMGEDLLKVAKDHLTDDIRDKVEYHLETIEDYSKKNIARFDAVVASEVLEHVTDKSSFLEACTLALKPGGSIFLTTMNKTQFARFAGIFVAENILRLVPPNTHQWEKFISPEDVSDILKDFGCQTVLVHGMAYEFWCDNWEWCSRQDINYALHAIKN